MGFSYNAEPLHVCKIKKRYCHSVPQTQGGAMNPCRWRWWDCRPQEPCPLYQKATCGLHTSRSPAQPPPKLYQVFPGSAHHCKGDHSHRGAATCWCQGPHPKNHPVPETWLRRFPGRQQQQDRSCLSLATKRGLPHSKSSRMGPGGLWDRHKTCSRISQRTGLVPGPGSPLLASSCR